MIVRLECGRGHLTIVGTCASDEDKEDNWKDTTRKLQINPTKVNKTDYAVIAGDCVMLE